MTRHEKGLQRWKKKFSGKKIDRVGRYCDARRCFIVGPRYARQPGTHGPTSTTERPSAVRASDDLQYSGGGVAYASAHNAHHNRSLVDDERR